MSAKSKKNKFIPGRSFFLMTVCTLACTVVILRLFYLQVISYESYQSQVVDNTQTETTVPAERGIIYDRNMDKLAINRTVYRLFISPRDIEDSNQAKLISTGLSDLLGVDYQTVLDNANKSEYADRTVKKDLDEQTADLVRTYITENGFQKQIHLEASSKRYYPYNNLASNVLGFVGTDGGLLGLELKYNTYLTGVPGRYVTAKDASGQNLDAKYDTYIETQNGANLITTIDSTMQRMLENELAKTYVDSQAQNRVTGIVMNPNTGEIYAMGTYPDYNANSPYTLDKYSQQALDALNYPADSEQYNTEYMNRLYKMWSNKAVSELYEPGSTFKIITSASAVEEKAVAWDTPFYCSGVHVVAGVPIHCHKLIGHGNVTFAYGLQQSCNPTLMMTAEQLGREKFYKYFQAFGYTEKTGVDLPGEANTLYTPYDNFNAVELACYSFGQTFKVTALQQLTAICSIANGGYLVTPHVVSQVVDNDGNILLSNETDIKRQVISTEVCKQLTAVLEQGVATDGAAKNAYVAGYKIAAKTGTSEVRDMLNEEGESYLRVGSCVGFAPADDPQIAILIVVDQPQCVNVYGSWVAAPYVASFFSQVLPYIGIEPNYTPKDLANLAVTLRNYVGLTVTEVSHDLTTRGISFTVEGDGDTVTYQIPAGSSSLKKDTGKVIIYSGDAKPETYATVPDVISKTASKANADIINAGLNILIKGATNTTVGDGAVAISQEPAAGTKVAYGTVVTVTMRYIGDRDD